ncbi:DEAD/DEAH box helicase, partial [Candidatus Aminicenantes bacterium AC-334-E05]|nr:DEAD/DEAH box helicase [Candidatus Aminicenantes bacterium AC-334-E05]
EFEDLRIKERLINTWHAFFSPHARLLPIQRRAIPVILNGRDAILVSPSASGKTEAVIVPLVERLINEKWKGMSILYIVPTRALVNDIYERLTGPLNYLNIIISRKTMDRPEFNPDSPSSVLVLTPESFDSLLCRHSEVFQSLKAICLDEIHLLDGTPRGDQLRILIERVKALKREKFNIYLLSATIANPYQMGRRYCEEFEVIEAPWKRIINYSLIPLDDQMKSILEEIYEKRFAKILFFCNTRKETENIAFLFKKYWSYPDRVFTHHANLSKKERELTEKEMNQGKIGLCVSTMTLELGIDIGDVDAVFLLSPPPSVTSLLQRIGRASRRSEYIQAYGVYTNEWERKIFEIIFELANQGWMEKTVYYPHYSTIAQQILSLVFQKKKTGISMSYIERILSTIGIVSKDIHEIIENLINLGYLKRGIAGILHMDEKLDWIATRGMIHSNIESKFEEYEVIDSHTGANLGIIEKLSPVFILKGKIWEVVNVIGKRVFVKSGTHLYSGEKKVFAGKGEILWDFRLGIKLKEKFTGAFWNELPYIKENGSIIIFPFLGKIGNYLWARAIEERKIEVEEGGGIYIRAKTSDIESLLEITSEELSRVALKTGKIWERFLNLGNYYRLLPPYLKGEAILKALNIEVITELIQCQKPKRISVSLLDELMELLNK